MYKDVIHEDSLEIEGENKAQHAKLVSLVERMLELHKRSLRTLQEQEMVQCALGRAPRMIRSSPAADGRIDRLVYELYGLTEEEIKIVEG